jgi:glutathione peroxidase
MFSKIDVNGPNASPVYSFLRVHSELYNAKDKVAGEVPWNFAKFLVNGQG